MRGLVSDWGAVAAGGLLAAGVGWLVGSELSEPREVRGDVSEEASEARCVPRSVAEISETREVRGDPEGVTWEQCLSSAREHRLRAARRLTAALAARAGADGDHAPLRWASDPPPQWTSPAFREHLERAVESCGVFAEVVAVDCDEPPCMAALSSLDTSLGLHDLLDCVGDPGERFSGGTAPVFCADGTEAKALVVGLDLAALEDVGDLVAPHEPQQALARRLQRTQALLEGARCPSVLGDE